MTTRSVFITGAAAGIGRATALRFAREGFHVGIYDVDSRGLEELSQQILAAGGSVRAGLLDVTNVEQWRSALEEFYNDTDSLDVLINNAGILSSGKFAEIPLMRQKLIVDVNVNGVLNGSHTAFHYLRDTPGSVVVNLCSASAIYGQADLATYGATKAAVKSLTEALDIEWSREGIRVIAVWPLFVKTAMTDDMNAASIRHLGIHLTPEDVASEIFKAATHKPKIPKVHYDIGFGTKVFSIVAKLSPNMVTRAVNRYYLSS